MNKQMQWTLAGGLLCLVVFGVTFFLNYVGDSTSNVETEPPPTETTQLAFAMKDAFPVELERGLEGHTDYWFYNPNDKPIPVGLNRLNCQCSHIDLWTVADPAAFRVERAAEAAGLFGAGVALGTEARLAALLRGVALTAVLDDPARMAVFESHSQEHALHDATVDVPVGAIGWVRLKWKNTKIARQSLGAELWYHVARFGPKVRLTVPTQYHDPFSGTVIANVTVPEMRLEQLPVTAAVYVWSYTRTTLDLKAVQVPLHNHKGQDTFVVGQPVAGSPEDYHKATALLAGSPEELIPFRCVYRIPFTLNSKSADGKTLCDQGGFVRRIAISLVDDPAEKVTYTIHGIIQGDLRIEGSQDGNWIDLGDFRRDKASATESRELATTLPHLELEIDRTRTATFLKADLGSPRPGADGGRIWTLKVHVEANKANGRFPSGNDPDYQDSAVYVHPLGGDGRTLRIAVRGNATE